MWSLCALQRLRRWRRRRQWEFLMRWFISMFAIKCTWNQLTIPSNRMQISGNPRSSMAISPKYIQCVIENITGCVCIRLSVCRVASRPHPNIVRQSINRTEKLQTQFLTNNVTNLYLFIFLISDGKSSWHRILVRCFSPPQVQHFIVVSCEWRAQAMPSNKLISVRSNAHIYTDECLVEGQDTKPHGQYDDGSGVQRCEMSEYFTKFDSQLKIWTMAKIKKKKKGRKTK